MSYPFISKNMSNADYYTQPEIDSTSLRCIEVPIIYQLNVNNQKKQMKFLSFETAPKKLVLNLTNDRNIAKFTECTQIEDWNSYNICLYRTTKKVFGAPNLPAIRFRASKEDQAGDKR